MALRYSPRADRPPSGITVKPPSPLCLSNSWVTDAHHIISQEHLLMLDLFEKSFEHIPRVEHGDWPRVLIQDGYVLQPPVFHRRPHVMQQVIGVEGHDGPGHDGRCHHWLIWRTTSVLLMTPTIRSSALHTTTRSAPGSRRSFAASMSEASSPRVMSRLDAAGRILSTRITSISDGR